MATPWNGQPLWCLQLLALGVLAWLLRAAASAGAAALLGWVFSTAWLAATFWWLYIAMHVYGGLPALLTGLAILSLAGALALYYAAACAASWLWGGAGPVRSATVFAAAWMLAELARSVWFTGFGWGASSYAHVDGPLAGYAPWVGAFGIGALAAAISMAGANLLRSAGARVPPTGRGHDVWLHLLLLPGLLVVPLALARHPGWSNSAGRLQVTLLQGNIPQDEKFESGSGVPLALQWFGAQLLQSKGSLVVAPETAIPLLPSELPDAYLERLQQHFSRGDQAALVGIPLGDYEHGYTNSVIGLRPGLPTLWRYDKHHLVPFGEFIPPLFKWFTTMMHIPLGDFNRGAIDQASFAWQGQRLAPNICYEDLFGEELGRRFINAQTAPTLFVNSSNIGWFGDSVAIDQHLQISRMRALEFERGFVRATNTGATVIMDHRARVTAALPRYTRAVLDGEVEGRTGITPFAWWVARFGLWPLWLLAGATMLLAWYTSHRGASR